MGVLKIFGWIALGLVGLVAVAIVLLILGVLALGVAIGTAAYSEHRSEKRWREKRMSQYPQRRIDLR